MFPPNKTCTVALSKENLRCPNRVIYYAVGGVCRRTEPVRRVAPSVHAHIKLVRLTNFPPNENANGRNDDYIWLPLESDHSCRRRSLPPNTAVTKVGGLEHEQLTFFRRTNFRRTDTLYIGIGSLSADQIRRRKFVPLDETVAI